MGQVGVDEIVHRGGGFRGPEFSFGLTFVLKFVLGNLHSDDGGQALADILSIDFLGFFDDAVLDGPIVYGAGDAEAQAGFVGSAIVGAHGVRVTIYVLVVILAAPLEGDFHLDD